MLNKMWIAVLGAGVLFAAGSASAVPSTSFGCIAPDIAADEIEYLFEWASESNENEGACIAACNAAKSACKRVVKAQKACFKRGLNGQNRVFKIDCKDEGVNQAECDDVRKNMREQLLVGLGYSVGWGIEQCEENHALCKSFCKGEFIE